MLDRDFSVIRGGRASLVILNRLFSSVKLCVCVCTHVFHLLTCMLSKAGQGLLICKLSFYSGTSLKAICICVLSLRVMHTDEKIQMCVCVCVCVIDFDSAEADLSYSPDVATQGYLP